MKVRKEGQIVAGRGLRMGDWRGFFVGTKEYELDQILRSGCKREREYTNIINIYAEDVEIPHET